MPTSDPADRPYEVVLFGATGFVGQLTARHLAAHADGSTRIALAGRSLSRLEQARAELGGAPAGWPFIRADARPPRPIPPPPAQTPGGRTPAPHTPTHLPRKAQ